MDFLEPAARNQAPGAGAGSTATPEQRLDGGPKGSAERGRSVAIIESRGAGTKADSVAGAGTTLRLVAGYLLLTAPLLPLGGVATARIAVAVLHVAGAIGLLVLARPKGPAAAGLEGAPRYRSGGVLARLLGDWAPLLLLPLLYVELPILMGGLPGPVRYYDPIVAEMEGGLFGYQPAFEWAGAWPSPVLSELLHASYLSYYALIYLPPLLLYVGVTGARDPVERSSAFHETVLALTVTFLVCFAIFVVFPVQGPRYLGVLAGVPDGPARDLVLAVLERGSSRGAAFPSSHVAVAVAQALLALRHQPRLGRWVMALALGLAAGAVYGGFHYAVDALAGVAVGAVAVFVARPRRPGKRSSERVSDRPWTRPAEQA